MTHSVGKARYRAPVANGEVLCVPSQEVLPSLVEDNLQQRQSTSIEILGQRLPDLARAARKEVVAAAKRYTASYADVDARWTESAPIVISGHQPELFHPGVWLKNFAAASLANRVDGVALNLIIDSDLCRAPSINVPSGTVEAPMAQLVPYDIASREMPFEERKIEDRSRWCSFAETTSKKIAPLVADPMIKSWWPKAISRSEEIGSLGYCLTQARHQTEIEWGNTTLEIPQSEICRTRGFRQFVLHLLIHAERLRTTYNAALVEYRRAHRLRNRVHPMPDLIKIDDWVETPFWTWSHSKTNRKPLLVRSQGNQLLLHDRGDWQASLPVSQSDDFQSALEQMEAWEAAGRKIRTRALTTTMVLRLLVADAFIHGIGGAKYDEVTDSLCENFFGEAPPPYITVSGTLRLPIGHQEVPAERDRELTQQLRKLRYHPEKFLDRVSLDGEQEQQVKTLVAEKHGWIHTTKTPDNAAKRHEAIERVNHQLQPAIAPVREAGESELQRVKHLIRNNRLLESREFSFCLFPMELLRKFLLDF